MWHCCQTSDTGGKHKFNTSIYTHTESMWHCCTNCTLNHSKPVILLYKLYTTSLQACGTCTNCTLHHVKHVTLLYKLYTHHHVKHVTVLYKLYTTSSQACDTVVQTAHYIISSMWHCRTNCTHITSSMWHCCTKLHTPSHQTCDTVVQQVMFFRLHWAKHKFHVSIYTHNEKPGQQDHPPIRIMGRFFILDRLVIPQHKRETACLSSVHHNRLPKHVCIISSSFFSSLMFCTISPFY